MNFIRRGLRTSLAALIVVPALPAASMAGTASTVVDGQKRWVVYKAGVGEVNDLLVQVSRQSRTVRLMDDGAAIVAGRAAAASLRAGCIARSTGSGSGSCRWIWTTATTRPTPRR